MASLPPLRARTAVRENDQVEPSGDTLLVAVSDRISEWIEKGEVVDRYFNPGNRFASVQLLLTNDDAPDPAALQRLVGDASVGVHNLPSTGTFLRTAGWTPALLRRWARGAAAVAAAARPALVRCHGAHLNGICALEIRRTLGVPFVASLHTLPGDPATPPPAGARERVEALATARLRRTTLRGADAVLAVYTSLLPYLEDLGARRVELAYNVLNAGALAVKDDYRLHGPLRVVSVGRLIPGKDPRNLILAVAARPPVTLTIVGDGPLAPELQALARSSGASDRVRFVPAMPNDELVRSLAEYDLFAAANDYLGVPKAVLEPMLAGLPVLLNRGAHGAVQEVSGGRALLVDDSPAGYGEGIERLAADEGLRRRLGRAARAWADEACAPERAERRVVEIYEDVLAARRV